MESLLEQKGVWSTARSRQIGPNTMGDDNIQALPSSSTFRRTGGPRWRRLDRLGEEKLDADEEDQGRMADTCAMVAIQSDRAEDAEDPLVENNPSQSKIGNKELK